jgi:4-hydroxy-tetrahydrodipicolinate synthase
MNGDQFTGLGVALATPFDTGMTTGEAGAVKPSPRRQPRVDLAAYRRLVHHVIAGGADYVVVLGSTGEAATVTDEERAALTAVAVEAAAPTSTPVVVGVGHHDTERTCDLAEAAVAAGADGLLVVTPYYNKPQPSGLVAHYRAVADACPGTPVIAYNVPGRTGCNLTPGTMQRLWGIPEVVALKESSGDLRQMAALCHDAPWGCHVIAGDDDLALPAIAVGAQGLISVCGNVAPARTAELVHSALVGDLTGARALARRLAPLMEAMFVETNPVPVKAALACMGIGTGMVRAPLAPAEPETWSRVQAALSGLGVARVPATLGATTPAAAALGAAT